MIPEKTIRQEEFDGEYHNLLEEIEDIPLKGSVRDSLVKHVYVMRNLFKQVNDT